MPLNVIATREHCPSLALTIAVTFSPAPAQAEEVVQIGGGRAILNLPAGRPSVGFILLPGGDGDIGISDDGSIDRQGNWIVRTRGAYRSAGMASLLLDAGADVGSAMVYMRRIAPRVVLVAMSRGSTKVPGALSYNPDGVVLASSMLSTVRGSLWSASSLPPTLVLHHRRDECRVTHAADVEPFAQWAGIQGPRSVDRWRLSAHPAASAAVSTGTGSPDARARWSVPSSGLRE